jgi:ribonuclease HI
LRFTQALSTWLPSLQPTTSIPTTTFRSAPPLPHYLPPTLSVAPALPITPAAPLLLAPSTPVMYTDGSYIPPTTTTPALTGSGVYIYRPSADPISLRINPAGSNSCNTINRAELAALSVAIDYIPQISPFPFPSPPILTDSLCSMYQLHGILTDPNRYRLHKHNILLADMARRLSKLPPSSLPVHLYKVVSHTGVPGNDIADTLAKAACTAPCHHSVTLGNSPWSDTYWPHVTSPAGTSSTPVDTLNKHLRKPCQTTFRLGKRKTCDSIYWSNYQSIVPVVHSTFSHLFLTSKHTTFSERRAALRFRGGCLLHIHTQPPPTCPLCSLPDSASHTLMSCKFTPLDNLRTDRHNHAARLIFTAIHSGAYGSSLLMVDVGSKSKRLLLAPTLYPLPTSIPPTILNLTPQERQTFKPDGLFIIKSVPTRSSYDRLTDTVHIIEFKFCVDAFYHSSISNHSSQHQALVAKFRSEGWHRIRVHNLRLGVGGSIFTDTRTLLTTTFGVHDSDADCLFRKLHFYSISSLSVFFKTRHHYVRASANEPHFRPP